MHKLVIIGAGPGDGVYLTVQAVEYLQKATCIAAARRHAPLARQHAPIARIIPLEPLTQGVDGIAEALKTADVAVLVSGDPTLFSLSKTLTGRIPRELATVVTIPGIGSMNVLLARLNESADGAKIISAHGRDRTVQSLVKIIAEHGTTVIFADSKHNPSWLCEALTDAGMGGLDVAVGENLSYGDERVVTAQAHELRGQSWGESCLIRVRNEAAQKRDCAPMLADTDFERGSKQTDGKVSVVPMTKEEVRMLSVCKLHLTDEATVWDIGAGTGSVAVQCARLISGMVYAVEREKEAIALIEQNALKLGAPNLIAVQAEAPDGFADLPTPTHVFIGGSGGELPAILDEIARRGSGIRVVLNAILPETAVDAVRFMEEGFSDVELMQVQISVGKKMASGHLMSAHNPVYIISAVTA